MNSYSWPGKDYREDSIIEQTKEVTFHIGQGYFEEVDTALMCKKCRGTAFNVGQGEYHTSIKCPTCGWELCIHEG
jgi:hypothetical protein